MVAVSLKKKKKNFFFFFFFYFFFFFFFFFFFKQKTAYEIVVRDWSSDVCSSDLPSIGEWRAGRWEWVGEWRNTLIEAEGGRMGEGVDRKSVV